MLFFSSTSRSDSSPRALCRRTRVMNYDSSKNTTIMSCSSRNPPSPVIDPQTDSKTTAASAKKNHFCRELPLQKKNKNRSNFTRPPGGVTSFRGWRYFSIEKISTQRHSPLIEPRLRTVVVIHPPTPFREQPFEAKALRRVRRGSCLTNPLKSNSARLWINL